MIFEIDDIVTIKAPHPPTKALIPYRIYGKEKTFGWWVYSLESLEHTRWPEYAAVYGSNLTLVRRGDPCDCDPIKKFKPNCLECVLKRFP